MLDLNLIRENPEFVKKGLEKKGYEADIDKIVELINERKNYLIKVDELKTEKNKLTATVPMIKKQGGDASEVFAKVKEINAQIEEVEGTYKKL